MRLLWLSPDGGDSVCIPIEGAVWPVILRTKELDLAVADGRLQEVKDTALLNLCNETRLSAVQREKTDAAWTMISGLVELTPRIFDPRQRSDYLKAAAKRHNVQVSTVRKHLRRYWQRGQTKVSLQPDFHRCGGPGGQRTGTTKLGRPRKRNSIGLLLTDKDHKAMAKVIKKYYLTERRFPLTKVYDYLLNEHYNSGTKQKNGVSVPVIKSTDERPSLARFRYYLNKNYRKDTTLLKRKGSVNYGRNHRGLQGVESQMAIGPGAIYQIDATTADVHLVHSVQTGLVVGRPTLYLVIDTCSGLVAGLHVTFGSPSYSAAGAALWNAYSDKVEYCKRLGIDIDPEEWPCKGLPRAILADRGEMLSKNTDAIVQHLGVAITNTAPYRADAKGLVERHFRLSNDKVIRWLPAAVPDKETVGAARRNYRKETCLTREEFVRCLIHSILAHNTSIRSNYPLTSEMIRDRIEPRPHKIWAWARPRLKQMDPACIRICLLPKVQASITSRGIRVFGSNGALYTCDREQAEGWRAIARAKKTWKVDCYYEPDLVDTVYLTGQTIGDVDVCYLDVPDRHFAGLSWAELKTRREAEAGIIAEGQARDQQKKSDCEAQVRDVITKAERRKGAHGDPSLAEVTIARADQRIRDGQAAAKTTQKIVGANPPTPVVEVREELGDEQAREFSSLFDLDDEDD